MKSTVWFCCSLSHTSKQSCQDRRADFLKFPVHVTKRQNRLATWRALYFFMALALAFMAFILFMAFGAAAAAAFMRFIGMVSELKVYLASLTC